MCQIVVINRGEKELTCPNDLIEHFNLSPEQVEKHLDEYTPQERSMKDCCLCGSDLDELLKELSIEYKEIDGDYYVGLLNELYEDI